MMLYLITLTLGMIFLLSGMKLMRYGLQSFAGSAFAKFIDRMTATPWRSMGSGVIASAILQSSTALTVMTVSLVDAGLLPFENSLGLILGSNIGTTVTTQLMALPLGKFSIYILCLGAMGFLFFSSQRRYLALAISGLGLIFLSLTLLKSGMAPLTEYPALQTFLHQLGSHHLRGILAGAFMAALMHSSGATTGIAMILVNNGWITFPTALAFVFGANIGTCITALIASLAANSAAQRVALFHVLLNFFGVLLFYPFLNPLAHLLPWLGGSLAQQTANAHTLFNLVSSLLAFPLLPLAARLLRHWGKSP